MIAQRKLVMKRKRQAEADDVRRDEFAAGHSGTGTFYSNGREFGEQVDGVFYHNDLLALVKSAVNRETSIEYVLCAK